MSIDRTTILKGPCKLTHNSAIIFSEGDVKVDFITDYFDVNTSAFARLGKRVQSRRIEVTLTPKMWQDLTKLFPYATALIGSTIFGATDLPLVITPAYGAPLTLANAAVTVMPAITCSHGKPLLRGSMKFTALCANSGDPATAANWFAWGTPASAVALTGFDLTKVFNTRYSLGWNSGTYQSEGGYDIDFSLELAPDMVDGEGVVNYRITALNALLKFIPTGKTEADFATLLGWDTKAPGMQPALSDAVITGAASGSPIITIKNCQLDQGAANYGAAVGRLGEVQLSSIRTVTAGALDALWTFAAAA